MLSNIVQSVIFLLLNDIPIEKNKNKNKINIFVRHTFRQCIRFKPFFGYTKCLREKSFCGIYFMSADVPSVTIHMISEPFVLETRVSDFVENILGYSALSSKSRCCFLKSAITIKKKNTDLHYASTRR